MRHFVLNVERLYSIESDETHKRRCDQSAIKNPSISSAIQFAEIKIFDKTCEFFAQMSMVAEREEKKCDFHVV